MDPVFSLLTFCGLTWPVAVKYWPPWMLHKVQGEPRYPVAMDSTLHKVAVHRAGFSKLKSQKLFVIYPEYTYM